VPWGQGLNTSSDWADRLGWFGFSGWSRSRGWRSKKLSVAGRDVEGLSSFFIGTVVDLSRERFEVLRNSALRVVSAGRSYLLVGRHFVAIARTRWWKNKVLNVLSTDSGEDVAELPFEPGQCDYIYINEFSVKAGEDGRIVFNRICFYKEYTLPWGWR
jgi:hypothetical protein